ncbi:endopeptidase La [Nitratidesulfovibrio vulgaris]|uniref:Lon protease n=1 Tax=Nitratidesulfovibrio vulgaris (strain ATCC 29579 / DSM 644 / CCUG 34227 / NCIMB 8303 / VKM B-1760 / Hildenborough) TaxID=882 RepID=Q72CU2_NITV2|nr:endopeptidase La [Nitratidesulfovibrio vulgaris]AAS95669.1 ATP-dependent protease La, putative [Nitratidesulfovibrio vulgaris str. Hildenborough]ADP86260.1 ATP-dependent protease La [Nitratidesulfovibrio vulgaris RCH1]
MTHTNDDTKSTTIATVDTDDKPDTVVDDGDTLAAVQPADTPEADGKSASGADDENAPAAEADDDAGTPESDDASPASDDAAQETPEIPQELPVLPVRDVVVFNYMILPLFVGREKSVQAVDAALNGSRYLMVCTQHDEQVDDPTPDDLHHTGTVVMIMRMLKMPDGRIKVLVQGVTRAHVDAFTSEEPHISARVTPMPEVDSGPLTVEQEAMMRTAREQSEKILSLRGISTSEIMSVLNSVDEPGRLADLIAANLRMKVSDAQDILECVDPVARLELVNKQLMKEAEVASMQAKIQSMAREGMDKAQKDYFLREQLKAIRRELGESGNEDEELEELARALDIAKLPRDVRKEADKQLRRLAAMHPDSSEATVTRTYLEWLSELPWRKLSRDRLDIRKAKVILDEDHFGLDKVKDRILEYLSVRKLNPDSKGPILCFAGPPGVGKTSLGRSIARTLGRKFQRISLGGMRDEAEIRGHRRTYIGSMPGRIIQSLKQCGTRNPVIMLDEIDKIGADFRGDPSSALLEVLDPEQNWSFSDHYLNVPFDLSKVMFICTANQLDTIPAPLRDRMEIISIPGYTMQEKVAIARRHLVPRQATSNGLGENEITIGDAAIETLVRGYTREAGLRNLEREIGSVCRKLARRKAEGSKGPFRVTPALTQKLLGAPRFLEDEHEKELLPGVALGLAWTPYGGEVLNVEVSPLKGKGKLILTGQLGDVMKESAQAAVSYARSRAEELDIDPGFAEDRDLHIHVPAGATPKDGPSAGVTLVTALISALTGRPVRSDLCMTGEITLRGRVLPVGGIKEKILAGVARGLKHVVIPAQNAKDLEDVPADLLRRIEVHLASHIDDVLPVAFKPN